MRLDRGAHWFGKYELRLGNPEEQPMIRWRRVMDAAAPTLHGLGIKVVNASPVSLLQAYPFTDLCDAVFDAEGLRRAG